MTSFETVRVAAVQATPVILDADATVAKVEELLREAASAGAKLAVFPESFVPLYPSDAWAKEAASFEGFDELWERMWASSVDVPGPLTDRIAAACAEESIHCVIGVSERIEARPGTLYNTMLTFGPGGLLTRHRKLMPTHHERLFWGIGPGDDLEVVDTPIGRLGGLICWENMMPVARYRVYEQGPQIWAAPNADDEESWTVTARHIALESGAFVVSAPQYIPASAFPDDFPATLPEGEDVFLRGGALIADPLGGEIIAGPLYGEEGIVIADCDLRHGLYAKRWFDVAGHYSRDDVLLDAPRRLPAADRHVGGLQVQRAGDGDERAER
jgi:nitrilase